MLLCHVVRHGRVTRLLAHISHELEHVYYERWHNVGKAHISLRIDNDLMERVKSQKLATENNTDVFSRVLVVGCNVLESTTDGAQNDADGAQRSTRATAGVQGEAQNGAQGDTLLIGVLQAEIARLEAEHEADRKAIAAKDEQIARALEKAHALAEQAHILMQMNTRVDALPAAEIVADDEHEQEQEQVIEQEQQQEQPRGFFARLFGL